MKFETSETAKHPNWWLAAGQALKAARLLVETSSGAVRKAEQTLDMVGRLAALVAVLTLTFSTAAPAPREYNRHFHMFPSLFTAENRFLDFGSVLTNGIGAAFNTALGRDCKGRPAGDYFFGCQVTTNQVKYAVNISFYWKFPTPSPLTFPTVRNLADHCGGNCLFTYCYKLHFQLSTPQCIGPFNIGRRRRSAQQGNTDTRFFINSNQGAGGDFIRCSVATVLNRNTG